MGNTPLAYIKENCYNKMRIIARRTLREFWAQHGEAKGPLEAWYMEVKHATWKTPTDVKARYPKASVVGGHRVVFKICHNKYRLVVLVKYAFETVYVRFIGTHDEYDRIDVKEI